MDLTRVLNDLYAQKEKLERTIAALQRLQQDSATATMAPKRRGRYSMGVEERQEVALRMKRYWASRRNVNLPSSPD